MSVLLFLAARGAPRPRLSPWTGIVRRRRARRGQPRPEAPPTARVVAYVRHRCGAIACSGDQSLGRAHGPFESLNTYCKQTETEAGEGLLGREQTLATNCPSRGKLRRIMAMDFGGTQEPEPAPRVSIETGHLLDG